VRLISTVKPDLAPSTSNVAPPGGC